LNLQRWLFLFLYIARKLRYKVKLCIYNAGLRLDPKMSMNSFEITVVEHVYTTDCTYKIVLLGLIWWTIKFSCQV